jgi:transposase InsO family protein
VGVAVLRRGERHAQIIKQIGEAMQAEPTTADMPLGELQDPRRVQERHARQQVVAFSRWTARLGFTGAKAAGRLGIHPRTLQHWQGQWQENHLAAAPRGRPQYRTDAITKSAMVEVLEELGPSIGVPTLKLKFPTVPRSQLGACCRAYHRDLYVAAQETACHLTWIVPGSVWATDFTEPPQPIDGLFPYVLLVRDLAASRQLLAMPATAPLARVVVAAMLELFLRYGAPLVIKADNGKCFVGHLLLELMMHFGVTPLFSPPYLPQYNGAVEAGNGSLKTYTRLEALRHGRTVWTPDDLEVACEVANCSARPWGATGPSPNDRWDARRSITDSQRQRFQTTLATLKPQVAAELGLRPQDLKRRAVRAIVDRTATRRALEGLGFLFVSGGPFRPPLNLEKCHGIS